MNTENNRQHEGPVGEPAGAVGEPAGAVGEPAGAVGEPAGAVENRVAVVTGGASGIGAALVAALTGAGASVLAVDLNREALDQIERATGCVTLVEDVSTVEGNELIFDAAIAAFGQVDLVFLNAGILGRPYDVHREAYSAADIDLELWQRVRSVNLDSVVFGTAVAARHMRGAGGAIIATASTAGLVPWTPTPMYAATKTGVVGWVRAIAPSLAAEGIRLNAICPAGVSTPLVGRRAEEAGGRLLAPSQVAAAMIETALGGGSGAAVSVVGGREPVSMPHEFVDVPGFP